MRIFIGDFETTPFDKTKESDYYLQSRFVCFKRLDNGKKYFYNIEKDGVKTIKEFILQNSSVNNPSRIYFHNLRFDLAFLFELLPKGYKYQVIPSNSKIIAFKVFKEYKRIEKNGKIRLQKKTLFELRDSLVLLLVSIEQLGLSLGYPKLEVDYFMKEITPEYIEYCFRDIEIVEKSLYNVINILKEHYDYDISINKLPLTLPALAKRVLHYILKKKYGNSIMGKIYDPYSTRYENMIREFYYGGRVEVFNLNCCYNGYYNDFNSHYPSVMYDYEFPLTPYKFYKVNGHENKFKNWNENKNVFACICELNENLDIPLIASKLDINRKLMFGIGNKRCLLFKQEIEYLLSLNQQVKIKAIITCNGYLPIFKDFIEIAYNIKKSYSHDSFEYLFAKIFMNSLYGKFAEKREKEKIEIINSIDNLTEKDLKEMNIILDESTFFDNQMTFIKRAKFENKRLKINIFYSMFITALARLRLHKEILKSKKPHYSDSDSIVSKDLIENSKELGHLSPEFTFERFQPLGCKEYIIEKWSVKPMPVIKIPFKENIVKMKGFGKLKAKDFNQFVSEFYEGKKQNRLIGFMEALNRQLPFNLVLVYNKYKNSVYDKRWILPDLTTKPFHLQNDDYNELVKNNEYYIKKIINDYKNEIHTEKQKLTEIYKKTKI